MLDAKNMSPAELTTYSDDHLHYELWMLYETADEILHNPDFDRKPVHLNMAVESFLVHARVLATFFYPEANLKTDVGADHFVRNVGAWEAARGIASAELIDVKKRSAKEIAHLTTGRQPDGPDKRWKPGSVLRAMEKPLAVFLAEADSTRLGPKFRTFANGKLAQRGAQLAPRAFPPSAPRGSVPTGRLRTRTDVSTPAPPPKP